MTPAKRTFTREELHDLVWSTPILKLAEEFGLSDRGFTKICTRHLVPTPPRGYWAKVEAGLPAKKTPLRSVENKALHTVEIGTRGPHSETILAALATAKAERKRISEEGKRTAAKAADGLPGTELIDADQLVDIPHRAIAQIAKRLQKAKPDSDGVISANGVCVHERTLERAIRILHHLARAAETNDVEVMVAENSLHVSTSEGSVSIVLTEERRRLKHTPTEAELAEYQRLKAKLEKERNRRVFWIERLEPWPEFDIVYTGKLTIGYNGYSNFGLRKSWSDGKSQTVERCLLDFVVGMKTIIAAIGEEKRKAAERARNREEMQHRRELARLRSERENKRSTFLEEIAASRRKVADMQLTIDAIPKAGHLPAEYERMIGWAKKRLAELEAQTTIEAIQGVLVGNELFPEPDSLFDPEGEPPPKQNYWDD